MYNTTFSNIHSKIIEDIFEKNQNYQLIYNFSAFI